MDSVAHRKRAFSLMEMLVVITVIGILIAGVLPAYKRFTARAKQAEAKMGLANIYAAMEAMHAQYQTYSVCYNLFGPTCQAVASRNYFGAVTFCVNPQGHYAFGFPIVSWDTGAAVIRAKGGPTTCQSDGTPTYSQYYTTWGDQSASPYWSMYALYDYTRTKAQPGYTSFTVGAATLFKEQTATAPFYGNDFWTIDQDKKLMQVSEGQQ
jgi:prepilin-type N-terminal cleavage/methylation domain-containing protein